MLIRRSKTAVIATLAGALFLIAPLGPPKLNQMM